MNQVVSLKTLSKIEVTENCGNVVVVTLVNTNITITKPSTIVSVTNYGS